MHPECTTVKPFKESTFNLFVLVLVLTPVKGPSQADMEGLRPVGSEDTSSQGSSSGPREIDETIVTELSIPDEKVTQIESILDLWSGSLKVLYLY